jgi:hypothetical protein
MRGLTIPPCMQHPRGPDDPHMLGISQRLLKI